jgi:hypothetical protein
MSRLFVVLVLIACGCRPLSLDERVTICADAGLACDQHSDLCEFGCVANIYADDGGECVRACLPRDP